MELLAASLIALAVGPVAVRVCSGKPALWQGLDAFIFVSILGLVGLSLLPNALHAGGGWAALALLAGFLLPSWLAHRFSERAGEAQNLAMFLGLLALVLHALVDGVALVAPSVEGMAHGEELAWAVLIHRLPVGLTVWWLLRERRPQAVIALLMVGAGTLVGFSFGDQVLSRFTPMALALFQAGLAGSLLHVVVHRAHPVEPSERARWFDLAGSLLAAAVVMVSLSHHEDSGLGGAFLELAAASAPALLLAYLGAGLLFTYVPAAGVAWLGRGSALSQAGRGMLFGLPLPICSCGVLPLYHSLVRRGVPSAAAFAFLVATPELGLDAIILSMPLLGGSFTLARVAAAALIAIGVGLVLSRIEVRSDGAKGSATPSPGERSWRTVWNTGFVEVLDETMPWVVFGVAVAALIAVEIDLSMLASLPNSIQLPLFALLGLPIYVCASGATPLVAVLIGLGVSPGAALVFLITGPATNVTTLGVLSRLHGRRVAVIFAVSVVTSSLMAGALVNSLSIDWGFPSLHSGHDHDLSLVEVISLIAMGLLMLASVWRQGARGFAVMVLGLSHWVDGGTHHHDHSHADEDGCCSQGQDE